MTDQLPLEGIDWLDLRLPASTDPAIRRAQNELIERAPQGSHCPCCGRLAKIYNTKLDSGMARSLIWLVQTYENLRSTEWIEPARSAPRHVLRSRKLGRLEHWRLIQSKPNREDPTRRHLGLWRPTAQGVDFVNRRISVPARLYFYANGVVGASKDKIWITDALSDRFDYEELMAAQPEIREGDE